MSGDQWMRPLRRIRLLRTLELWYGDTANYETRKNTGANFFSLSFDDLNVSMAGDCFLRFMNSRHCLIHGTFFPK